MDACGGFFLPDQGLFKVGLGGCLRKSACQTQDLVDPLELPVLALQLFDAPCLGRADSIALPGITFMLRIQLHSVCVVQPILEAMAWIAAHCELYSGRTSGTMRMARSRTSGENFVDFFIMAP